MVVPDGGNGFYVDQPWNLAMYSQYVGKELVEFTRKSFPLSHKREDTYIKRALEWLPLEGKMSGVSSGNIGR